jgi:hypothetical protein
MGKMKLIDAGGENGIADVVNNYRWSVSNKKIALEEVPRIYITEYQQSSGSIRQGMAFWANQSKVLDDGKTRDPYIGLYQVDSSEIGNEYILPYFGTYHHSIESAWGENKGSLAAAAEAGLNLAAQQATQALPSAGIESAKMYEGSSPRSYQFTFYLFNTVEPDTDIKKNQLLIKSMINNNLVDKVDVIAQRPPAICEVEIPGVRGRTIAVMSAINIVNVGQINYMPEYGGNIPDAYEISITIQELLVESRQIYANTIEEGKVFAKIDTPPAGIEETIDVIKKAASKAK